MKLIPPPPPTKNLPLQRALGKLGSVHVYTEQGAQYILSDHLLVGNHFTCLLVVV